MKPPWWNAALCRVTPGFEGVDGLLHLVCRATPSHLPPTPNPADTQPKPGGQSPWGQVFRPKHGEPGGPVPLPPALGEARSQPLPGEEGWTWHPTLFLLGGHMLQNLPRAGTFRPSVRMYGLWLLH